MTPEEAVKLCRYVRACCPQQAIDELTPLAWADHLEHVPYEDAKAAAKEITAKQPFVTIAEILTIVRQVRRKRIADAGDLCPPRNLTESQERAWLGDARRRIANGEDPVHFQLTAPTRQHDVIAELGQIGRAVPNA